MKNKHLLATLKSSLLSLGFNGSTIVNLSTSPSLTQLTIHLPPKHDFESFCTILPNLQQSLNALDTRIIQQEGKTVTVQFSTLSLNNVPFSPSFIVPGTQKVTFQSPFGPLSIDFEDGATCHMLNGGAPRMGKTIFLLYLSTLLYVQNAGNVEMYLTSPKARDFYPFENKKNVEIFNNESSLIQILDRLITEYKHRDSLLYLPQYSKATDSKSVKQLHPHLYHNFKPIYLIIDEFARFDKKETHQKVAELVQTAGYVNIHLIIATQRPEARTTLPANIKMGLMCRICFKTADTNNSIVILDEAGAENLPNIKGRAILRDGEKNIIQVPHMTYQQCEDLLLPYERNVSRETSINEENTGSTSIQHPIHLPNLFKESIGLHGIQEQQQSNKRVQQNNEKNVLKWSFPSSPTIKG